MGIGAWIHSKEIAVTLDQLVAEMLDRQRDDKGIDDLRDSILEFLIAYQNAPPPERIIRNWLKRLGKDAVTAELGIKHMDVSAEDFETLAHAARVLGKTRK